MVQRSDEKLTSKAAEAQKQETHIIIYEKKHSCNTLDLISFKGSLRKTVWKIKFRLQHFFDAMIMITFTIVNL